MIRGLGLCDGHVRFAFAPSCFHLLSRPPSAPHGRDGGRDVMMTRDAVRYVRAP